MDQLKPILAQIKKHHFWILCGIVAILCVVFGYLGTTGLARKWQARASEIDNALNTGRQIASIANHPNDRVAEQMKAVNRAQAEQVYSAWEERYRRQKEILVWPEELRQDFISKVEKLHPIELTVPYPEPPGFVLKQDYRSRYMNYIQRELPKLAEIIRARWTATAQSSGGAEGGYGGEGDSEAGGEDGSFDFGGGAGGLDGGADGEGAATDGEESPWVVNWDESNQSKLAARFDWGGVPTVSQILYAQEDLWILRSLMEIVRQTNGDADAQYNAAVKAIKDIRLGASAGGIKDGGKVQLLESAGQSGQGSSTGYGGMMGGASSGSSDSGAGSSGYGGMMGSAAAAAGPDPADNRYVDDKYAPVKGAQLRAAFKSTNPSDAFLVVAKRMPVRLRLEVDVLKLPRLLAECGNAKLTYEVRQVRINPQADAAGGGADGGGGYAGGGRGPASPGMGGGASGGMGPSLGGDEGPGDQGNDDSGYGGFGGAAGPGEEIESPYTAEVEIYGLIYLYNPPQRTKLGLPEEPEQPNNAQANNQPAGAPAAAGG